jgi:hypothetical protein
MTKNLFTTALINNWPFGRNSGHKRVIYQRIKAQVLTEYQAELNAAMGWHKVWIRQKINLIARFRYSQIVFMN